MEENYGYTGLNYIDRINDLVTDQDIIEMEENGFDLWKFIPANHSPEETVRRLREANRRAKAEKEGLSPKSLEETTTSMEEPF